MATCLKHTGHIAYDVSDGGWMFSNAPSRATAAALGRSLLEMHRRKLRLRKSSRCIVRGSIMISETDGRLLACECITAYCQPIRQYGSCSSTRRHVTAYMDVAKLEELCTELRTVVSGLPAGHDMALVEVAALDAHAPACGDLPFCRCPHTQPHPPALTMQHQRQSRLHLPPPARSSSTLAVIPPKPPDRLLPVL